MYIVRTITTKLPSCINELLNNKKGMIHKSIVIIYRTLHIYIYIVFESPVSGLHSFRFRRHSVCLYIPKRCDSAGFACASVHIFGVQAHTCVLSSVRT